MSEKNLESKLDAEEVNLDQEQDIQVFKNIADRKYVYLRSFPKKFVDSEPEELTVLLEAIKEQFNKYPKVDADLLFLPAVDDPDSVDLYMSMNKSVNIGIFE